MKSKNIFWISAITFIGFFSVALYSCSDDDTEPDSDTVTDIDGNEYQTVTIGDQEWMAENLRVTKYNNGDNITMGLNDAEWQNIRSGAYAVYPHGDIDEINSENEMVEAYGKLYNWYAVDDSKGLCPEGWRVPTDEEWTELTDYVGADPGRKLKSERTAVGDPAIGISTNDHPRWNYHVDNFGLDEYNFNALPGGYRHSAGLFGLLGRGGNWWSATEIFSTTAWIRLLDSSSSGVGRANFNISYGFSVRCVRDID